MTGKELVDVCVDDEHTRSAFIVSQTIENDGTVTQFLDLFADGKIYKVS